MKNVDVDVGNTKLGSLYSGRSISPSIWDLENEFLDIPSPIQSGPSSNMDLNGQRATTLGSLAVESLPTPVPLVNASKWKELFMGVGQIFANVDEFRGAVYKYSSAHNFPFYYVKNDKKK